MVVQRYFFPCWFLLVLVACQLPVREAYAAFEGPATANTASADIVTSLAAIASADDGTPFITFGQPFVAGDVARSQTIRVETLGGRVLPTQVDWKTSHPDGSWRFGVVTVALPAMKDGKRLQLRLRRVSENPGATPQSGAAAPRQPFDSRVQLRIDGEDYSASFADLWAEKRPEVWLDGPLVKEWRVQGPVRAAGRAHDRIEAYFTLRQYSGSDDARLEVLLENTWTFKPQPRNVEYGVNISINGQTVYESPVLVHTDHARWRRTFMAGGTPTPHVQHDLAYLVATGTIPNYDRSLRIPSATVANLYQRYIASDRNPMGISIVTNPMAQSGGRPDIGPLPLWTVMHLLTMDPRMAQVSNSVGELAGSWPIHLRDEATGLPVSIEDHPNLTTHFNLLDWKKNPLPEAEYGEYPNNLRADWTHQPSLAFVPFLLTGDYYYLEELQFWSAWNPLRTSPDYRGKDKGWYKWTQVRGQAWSLRTLAQTAYITPDNHPMKAYWNRQLQNNIDWYLARYPDNPEANKLGFLVGYMPYNKGRGLAPWQDDFFTWAMGYVVGLGFERARPMLEFKARFPVGRMTAPGYCWALGAIYTLNVRDSKSAPFYDTFAKAYAESAKPEIAQADCASQQMASRLGKGYRAGDMSGYPWSEQGFPANMQPALAAAVDAGVPNAEKAWMQFESRTTKPDYATYPNWAIVPKADAPR
ncbi:hypothetical protein SADO_15569 [Salinisphaera dokdonensis CL-ES53]|uniref:Uncharacterized protein n=2 Tax=Salinisphaera TaxID=180541 RepID=A0ABV2B462_9GAMM